MTAKECKAIADKYFGGIVTPEQQTFILDRCCAMATNGMLGTSINVGELPSSGTIYTGQIVLWLQSLGYHASAHNGSGSAWITIDWNL